MKSFALTAVGNLAGDPGLASSNGISYARICPVGNDYAGQDEEGGVREFTTSAWFTAFGALGEALAGHARKGDQLVLAAPVRTQHRAEEGQNHYEHSFIVDDFRFGAPGKARRAEFAAHRSARAASTSAHAPGVSEP
jgi:single-strand DNA-binding protein